MEKIVKSRGMSVKDNLSSLVDEKLDSLQKFDPNITECEVEFIAEPNPQRGDKQFKSHIVAHSKHGMQRVESASHSPEVAFYDVFEKVKRVMRKQREKAIEHR